MVILDLMLPTINGLDVLSSIRRVSDVPVIILAGRGDETDRIVGLRMGADEYVVKPFSPRELASRVGAVLRRRHRAPASRRLEFPGLVIDQPSHEVFVDDVEAALTSKEFELLNFLASSPRQVFSREQLLNQIWRSEAGWQESATITEHVARLRAAVELGLSNSKLEGLNSKIRLINHRGYGHHTATALIAMIYLCCGASPSNCPQEGEENRKSA